MYSSESNNSKEAIQKQVFQSIFFKIIILKLQRKQRQFSIHQIGQKKGYY